MRKIKFKKIASEVAKMFIDANINLADDTVKFLKRAAKLETKPLAKSVLKKCIENVSIAKKENIPICQDTGIAVFFIEMGRDVYIENGLLENAINAGIAKACKTGYLRASCASEPVFERKNTKNCTPAIIHLKQVKGNKLKISLMPKGGGAENTSKIAILNPTCGKKPIVDFVVDVIKSAGANSCPPVIVGIGIGGNFETSAILAKKALLRDLGSKNPNKKYAALEREIFKKINSLGIGAQGFGGKITALAVHIEQQPCHIASMPVAVNIDCWVHRHKKIIL